MMDQPIQERPSMSSIAGFLPFSSCFPLVETVKEAAARASSRARSVIEG
jgi:hypothetical protein